MRSRFSCNTDRWAFLFVCAALVFALAGCATYEQRLARIGAAHPDWDKSDVDRVAARVVAPGMTMEMVKEALGREGETMDDQRTGMVAWVYYKEEMVGWSPLWVPVYTVYFKDGRVAGMEGDKRPVIAW